VCLSWNIPISAKKEGMLINVWIIIGFEWKTIKED
jgi:hypothetical protein